MAEYVGACVGLGTVEFSRPDTEEGREKLSVYCSAGLRTEFHQGCSMNSREIASNSKSHPLFQFPLYLSIYLSLLRRDACGTPHSIHGVCEVVSQELERICSSSLFLLPPLSLLLGYSGHVSPDSPAASASPTASASPAPSVSSRSLPLFAWPIAD